MAATNIEVWQRAVVTEAEPVADGIRRIVLTPSRPVRAEAGSHIDLMVTIGGERERRSYSIVEAADDGSWLALSVFRAPQSRGGSIAMHALELGTELEITQPLQNFPLRVGAPSYLLLAGGVGVTAMVAMARVLARVRADYRIHFAGRSRSSMAYLELLQREHGERLTVHVDDEGTPLDVAALLEQVEPHTELYMCGPIRLMDAVRRGWAERDLDATQLRYETFGNSGWFDPEPFVVSIPKLGVEATVPPGRSMLEALEDAGVDMMFDCRRGECGLCEVRVLELDGEIDHRDVFYSDRQRDARAKLCCCVSRVAAESGSPAGRVTIEVS